MYDLLLLNGTLVNEGLAEEFDIAIKNGRVEKIGKDLQSTEAKKTLDLSGLHIFPGVIDDQVHFREPGLTHKADILSESYAAVAGGTTSFMEMPNTIPSATTQRLLEDKYVKAGQVSPANYSFFMGATNDNLDEVLRTDHLMVCGVKVFMGSSTGNMLVDREETLEKLFANTPMLVATHCEDEQTIRDNIAQAINKYGADEIPMWEHPNIRSVEACVLSSTMARDLALKHNTRLHILHISTADETSLFRNDIPTRDKRITSEACVHHLWFTADEYESLGSKIKCNPAIKEAKHREGIWEALLDDRIDVIATDHAPHTLEEKNNPYLKAPAGLPLIQFSLQMMLDHYHSGRISLEKIADKMSHKVADVFKIKERGYVREGYFADLAIVDLQKDYLVRNSDIHYKSKWSPLEGHVFKSSIVHTIVNGHIAFSDGLVDVSKLGERMEFFGHL